MVFEENKINMDSTLIRYFDVLDFSGTRLTLVLNKLLGILQDDGNALAAANARRAHRVL